MTEFRLDPIITADVRALALDSGHPSSPATEGVFRAARSYALAQRAQNLVERSAAIATARRHAMPIYAARAGRVAAGALVAVMSGLWLGSPGSVELGFLLATSMLSTIAYLVVRTLARWRFCRRLAVATPPLPEDPALAPRPGAIAEHGREQVDRLDTWATGATIAALAAFIPAVVFTFIARHYDSAEAARHVISVRGLLICMALGLVFVVLIVDAAHRARTAPVQPLWLRHLGGSAGLALGLAIAVIPAQHIEYAFSGGRTAGPRGLWIPICLELAALLVGAWLALRMRARENELLAKSAITTA